jgi:hypothetical protein
MDLGLAEVSLGDLVMNLGKEDRLFSVHVDTEVYCRTGRKPAPEVGSTVDGQAQ